MHPDQHSTKTRSTFAMRSDQVRNLFRRVRAAWQAFAVPQPAAVDAAGISAGISPPPLAEPYRLPDRAFARIQLESGAVLFCPTKRLEVALNHWAEFGSITEGDGGAVVSIDSNFLQIISDPGPFFLCLDGDMPYAFAPGAALWGEA